MIRSLPFRDWPQNDRLALEEACRPTVRLSKGGRISHMRAVTRNDLARRFGYFLSYVRETSDLSLVAPAGAHVTPKALEGFITFARPHWSSFNLAQGVFKLRRLAKIIPSAVDFSWLHKFELELRAVARPRRRREILTSDRLLEAGETMFREVSVVR